MYVHLIENFVHFNSMTMGDFFLEKNSVYLTSRYLYSFANMLIEKLASFCIN